MEPVLDLEDTFTWLFAANSAPRRATAALQGTGGRLRVEVEDFEVEELPEREPDGAGEHLFLWVEKRGVDARTFVRHLARTLEIDEQDIGYAGLKDAVAVTRQYVSVPARCESKLGRITSPGINLLRTAKSSTKLKTGHLLGNRFRVVVRDVVEGGYERALAKVRALAAGGLPNYYGMQRFGREGESLRYGLELLAQRARPRAGGFMLRLALSALQSALFNCYLDERLSAVGLGELLPGEVLQDVAAGWLLSSCGSQEERERLRRGELVPAGPMFGPKMRAAQGEAARRERELLARANLRLEDFARFGKLMCGTRRPLWVFPRDLAVTPHPAGLELCFSLPAGSYATVLLCELIEPCEPP